MATQILPHARPSAPAVLAYLAAGHTNADAAQHFGIHERSVRRIKQRAGAGNGASREPLGNRANFAQLGTGARAEPVTEIPNDTRAGSFTPAAPAPGVFPPTADDVAGDHSMWRCPATGELMQVIPGTHRQAWERERRETHARHVARVMSSSADRTPETTTDVVQMDRTGHMPLTAWESEMTGPDTRPEDTPGTGQNRTEGDPRGPRAEARKGAPPAGMVAAYLRHQADEVRRDGLLVLGWRWIDEHPMIGPFPTMSVVVLLAGLVLAALGVLG